MKNFRCPHCNNLWSIAENYKKHIYKNRREIYLISLRQRFLKQLHDFQNIASTLTTEKELMDLIKKQRIVTLSLNLKYDRGIKTFYDMWENGHNITETIFLTVEDVSDKITIDVYKNFGGGMSETVSIYIEVADDTIYSFTKDVCCFINLDLSLVNKIKLKQKLLR